MTTEHDGATLECNDDVQSCSVQHEDTATSQQETECAVQACGVESTPSAAPDAGVEAQTCDEQAASAAVQDATGASSSDGSPALPEISDAQATALLEALLLANGEPLSLSRIQEASGLPKARIKQAADRLAERYSAEDCGIEVVVVAEKLQLRTKAAFAEPVRQLMAVKPRKLSQAALETLAVIAYQQPVVKSEVDKIRGVDVAPTLKTLLERKLIKILGYQASVGQPALYGTTEDFLQVFGLDSLAALPAMRDLNALVKEPGEAQNSEDDEEVEAPVADNAPEGSPAHTVEAAAQ